MSEIRRMLMASLEDSLLPKEYKQVQYLESTGTQWIDSEVYANQSRTKIIIDCALPSFTSNKYCEFTGAFLNMGRAFVIGYESGKIVGQFNSWQKSSMNAPVDKTTFILENNTLKANGVIIVNQSSNIKNVNTETPIYLFGKSSPDGGIHYEHNGVYTMRIWHEQIFDSGVLVRDFYACYRKSDMEYGMYDIVNNKFHTNKGTGKFNGGPNV